MKDADDGERSGSRVINNQIRKYGPELDRQRGQISAEMSGLRMRSQQTKGRSNFLQYVSGEAAATLADEIASDLAEIFLRFRR
jgi:hypothetical protein